MFYSYRTLVLFPDGTRSKSTRHFTHNPLLWCLPASMQKTKVNKNAIACRPGLCTLWHCPSTQRNHNCVSPKMKKVRCCCRVPIRPCGKMVLLTLFVDSLSVPHIHTHTHTSPGNTRTRLHESGVLSSPAPNMYLTRDLQLARDSDKSLVARCQLDHWAIPSVQLCAVVRTSDFHCFPP